MRKIVIVAGVATLLAGCGDKGDIETAINKTISKEPVCYSFNSKQNNSAAYYRFSEAGVLVRVNVRGNDVGPILAGLKKSGLIDIEYEQQLSGPVAVLSATDKGVKAKFWDQENGACVGKRVVAEIKEWTEPGNSDSQKVTQVSYTWKLSDVPGWVDKDAFSSVKGMSEPEEARIVLVKTNNGWTAM
ncbi:DNA-directed RNA polymerase subunit beta [Kluyvera sichuanensis]|uniref:DNA-directed RNA polymerase subunit beta n=1 Tax=Kluyvera sichuanensis TaxID=2725494 RepID=UPI0039F48AD5